MSKQTLITTFLKSKLKETQITEEELSQLLSQPLVNTPTLTQPLLPFQQSPLQTQTLTQPIQDLINFVSQPKEVSQDETPPSSQEVTKALESPPRVYVSEEITQTMTQNDLIGFTQEFLSQVYMSQPLEEEKLEEVMKERRKMIVKEKSKEKRMTGPLYLYERLGHKISREEFIKLESVPNVFINPEIFKIINTTFSNKEWTHIEKITGQIIEITYNSILDPTQIENANQLVDFFKKRYNEKTLMLVSKYEKLILPLYKTTAQRKPHERIYIPHPQLLHRTAYHIRGLRNNTVYDMLYYENEIINRDSFFLDLNTLKDNGILKEFFYYVVDAPLNNTLTPIKFPPSVSQSDIDRRLRVSSNPNEIDAKRLNVRNIKGDVVGNKREPEIIQLFSKPPFTRPKQQDKPVSRKTVEQQLTIELNHTILQQGQTLYKMVHGYSQDFTIELEQQQIVEQQILQQQTLQQQIVQQEIVSTFPSTFPESFPDLPSQIDIILQEKLVQQRQAPSLDLIEVYLAEQDTKRLVKALEEEIKTKPRPLIDIPTIEEIEDAEMQERQQFENYLKQLYKRKDNK